MWRYARPFSLATRVWKGALGLGVVGGVGWLIGASAIAEEKKDTVHAPQVVTDSAPTLHQGVDIMKNEPRLKPAVYKIVLTGGPCGGKSTAVSLLTRRLQSLGFTIYIVPEAATLLFTGGARFDPSSLETELGFEANKIRVQIALEDAFLNLAKHQKNPCVIICDRGTMDSKAYVGPEKFSIMLKENHWTVPQLRDQRYDAVFHLITTAQGAEEFYSNATNQTRTEDATKARDLDLKILSAWVGHPKVVIIDNSTDFDGKMNRVVTQICRLLGVPRPRQIDRKYLVSSFHIPSEVSNAKHYTETTYLMRGGDDAASQGYLFLRKRGDTENSAQSYFYSAKHVFPGGESAVVERQISGLEYSTMLSQVDSSKKVVKKKVRVFHHDNHYFELEQWVEPNDGLVILKVSVDTSSERVNLPSFIKVRSEVTDDPSFSTHALASNSTVRWPDSPHAKQ